MRVALITAGLPLGGSTTFMLFLARGLKSMSIDAEVFSFTSGNPLAAEFSSAQIPVHTCNESQNIYEDRLQSLYRELRRFNPAVVMAILGVESFEMLRYVPVDVLRIGVILDMAIQPRTFVPRYAGVVDHIVVIAHYLIEEVKQAKDHPAATHISVGIPLLNDVSPREPNRSRPLRLIYYGRLEDESKGVRMFPKIVSALKRRNILFTWTIQGEGPEESYLRRELAAEVEDGTVCFAAPVPTERLASIVRAHDIYVLTSTNEGGPMTLLESMALGLVPVCGDIPALVQDVITSDNGFRVPRDDEDAYAEGIVALDSDRDLLERMSANARATITASFSNDAMARQYAQLFRSLQKSASPCSWQENITPVGLSGMRLLFGSRLGVLLRRIGKRLRG